MNNFPPSTSYHSALESFWWKAVSCFISVSGKQAIRVDIAGVIVRPFPLISKLAPTGTMISADRMSTPITISIWNRFLKKFESS